MLAAVYWEGAIPTRLQLALNVATLCGSMLGQVLFGILADIYGRRKMYGLELIVTMIGSLGFAVSSPGVNNSMSIIAWLVSFRLLTGVGIGADCPLSAVITAECVQPIGDCQPVGTN
jgi:MFS transporter, PHS family, inorganic phosphate transporter